MKLSYYPETDSLYIEFKAASGVSVREIANGLVADIDTAGDVVGLDIDGASARLDLSTLDIAGLPRDEADSDDAADKSTISHYKISWPVAVCCSTQPKRQRPSLSHRLPASRRPP